MTHGSNIKECCRARARRVNTRSLPEYSGICNLLSGGSCRQRLSLFKTRLKIRPAGANPLFSRGSETLRAETLWENATADVTVITTSGHRRFSTMPLCHPPFCTGFSSLLLLLSLSLSLFVSRCLLLFVSLPSESRTF